MSAGTRSDWMPTLPAEETAWRIRRLELATRFRPIHIQMLFLAEAPPARMEDYFYRPSKPGAGRSVLSRHFFCELMKGAGIADVEAKTEEACLGEFQRAGYFLTHALESPIEALAPGGGAGRRADVAELAHRFAPTVVQRILHSYKPRFMTLLFGVTRHFIPYLAQAGLRSRLLLYHDQPLVLPRPENPAACAQFRAGLAEVFREARRRTKQE